MNELEKKLEQCRKPTGEAGQDLARSMNISHRNLTQWGLSKIDIHTRDTILDVGCGGGKTVNELAHIASKGKIYGIDYSADCVSLSSKINADLVEADRVKISQSSVSTLPFSDNYFNIVTAIETYYFWPDLINDLKEIYRVLKNNGSIIMINEIYRHYRFEKRNSDLSKAGNFSYHSPEEFKYFFTTAGFSSVKIFTFEDNNWITIIGDKDI